ncbi:V-type ATP synthase subunit I [Plebeiibacterium sediminum]|uniref:V-type ATP synthase subunit I n=1 Tax=Plebeiibacterium sediminum TaxID=2992112 RepID=A0AAE3M3H8_9BACT|nr:V-type ATPase 116kDa subunit family protein [Plebeiobacterium sediminum]MCW3786383.1 V-type ATP synthase subunit I [Plebeiobacterium sediminum]
MIVPMFKYSFLVHHLDYNSFLEDLKKLGVVHIIQKKEEPSIEILDAYRRVNEVEKTMKTLSTFRDENAYDEVQIPQSGNEIMEAVASVQTNIEHYNQQISILNKELNQLLPWGNFSWSKIEQLENEAGVQMYFFYVSTKKFQDEWEAAYNLTKISEDKGYTYFVLVLENDQTIPDIDAEEVKLPKQSIGEIQGQLKELTEQLEQEKATLHAYANKGSLVLENYSLELKDALASSEAVHHTSDELEGQVKLMEGWAPKDRLAELDAYLENASVYYLKSEANHADKPPVQLKNNRFNRLFETISNLYALPSYNELDLTPFLAPFYLLFFGFCFSDAGYGLLFVLVATIVKAKQKEANPILSLIQLLGASTMFFGILGGTFFGIELYKTNLPVYRDLAKSMEASGITVQDIMFKSSLILGLIQMLFGMFLRAAKEIKQAGFIHAVSTLGWAFLIIASAVNYLVADKMNVEFMNIPYMIIGGICLIGIFFMNTPGKSLLLNFGSGLWDTYNTVVGGVGDLLSYVRLFALGLASAILGLVFNDLALKLINPEAGIVMQIVGFVLMLVILVVGHAINIFMSGLGSMVHPLRLTFVEFYKNAGFEGGGKAYNPFKKQVN